MISEIEKNKVSSERALDSETVDCFTKAGRISAEALEYGRTLVKRGARIVDVLDKVDEKIHQLGGECAFPSQMSLNDTAAHNCPDEGDEMLLGDQVVKLDVGAQVGGCVTDNALTVDLSGKWGDLVKASREALDAVLKIVAPDVTLGEMGRTVHDVIRSYGYNPIRNLSGHGIGKFLVHTRPGIPNFDTGDMTKLEAGMTIAIEPFASTGAGMVYERGEAGVFMIAQKKPVRDMFSRQVLQFIHHYNGLPFAKRWLTREFGPGKTNFALRQLVQLDIVREYPPLVDEKHGIVSQAEESVLVAEKPVFLTRF